MLRGNGQTALFPRQGSPPGLSALLTQHGASPAGPGPVISARWALSPVPAIASLVWEVLAE